MMYIDENIEIGHQIVHLGFFDKAYMSNQMDMSRKLLINENNMQELVVDCRE